MNESIEPRRFEWREGDTFIQDRRLYKPAFNCVLINDDIFSSWFKFLFSKLTIFHSSLPSGSRERISLASTAILLIFSIASFWANISSSSLDWLLIRRHWNLACVRQNRIFAIYKKLYQVKYKIRIRFLIVSYVWLGS